MTNQEYKIQECLNKETMKEYFVVLEVRHNCNIVVDIGKKYFDTLEEAKEAVRLLRKHRQPIYHYVED